MKALVWRDALGLHVTAYETGDEPEGAVDIPPALINEWQKARQAVTSAEGAITVHLAETGQRWER